MNWGTALPDETTILRFRRLLEEHKLAPQILALINELLSAKGLLLRAGTVVDATLIAAPSSSKNLALGTHAKALLIAMARQYVRNNNGRLLCSRAHMGARGWTSSDMLTKAKRELIAAGFLHEIVMGPRPAKTSWYALTWFALDRHPDHDPGVVAGFKRGAYRDSEPVTAGVQDRSKIARLRPSGGTETHEIAPSHVQGRPLLYRPTVLLGVSGPCYVPWEGHHLESHLSESRKPGLHGRTG